MSEQKNPIADEAPVAAASGAPLRVATLNLRFIVDRWKERRPYAASAVAELQSDVVCLQEMVVGGSIGRLLGLGQDADFANLVSSKGEKSYKLVLSHGEPEFYIKTGFGAFATWVSRWLFDFNPLWQKLLLWNALFNEVMLERIFGKHLMPVFESSFGPVAFVTVGIAFVFGKSSMVASSRATVPTDAYRDILTIGSNRTVSRMLVECGGQLVWVVNIHLHSPIDAAECRLEQMKQVLAWMGPVRQRGVGCIMMGDFNAGPAEPCYKLLTDLGWKSTHKLAHGQEPAVTFPGDGAGLMASTKDCDPAGTFDYIWLAGDVELAPGGESSCQLFAEKQCGDDPTLYVSDHYGLYADLRVGTGSTTEAAYAAAFKE